MEASEVDGWMVETPLMNVTTEALDPVDLVVT